MTSTVYDPACERSATEWLATPEEERLRQVTSFHADHAVSAGSAKAHAALHVIVENQIAMGLGPTVRAMQRLQRDGLERHEAIHAVGSVIARQMYGVLKAPPGAGDRNDPQAVLDAAIDSLDAQQWLRDHPR